MAMEKRAVTIEDFWSLKLVTDPQISPDGKTVAYVVGRHEEATNCAVSAIWMVDLDSGATRQFSGGESIDMQPRWSPDGVQLAFVSTRHEGKPKLFVMPVTGGEPRCVTEMEGGAHSPTWSPDGRRLCFCSAVESDRLKVPQETAWLEMHPAADQAAPRMRRQNSLFSRLDERGYYDRYIHLFVIDLDMPDDPPRQLTEGNHDDVEPSWSPKASIVAFNSNRTQNAEYNLANDVWTVNVDDGALRRLTDGNLAAFAPVWSSDGETLAFYAAPEPITNGYHDHHVWTVSRSGGDQRDVSSALDRPRANVYGDYMAPGFNPPAWSPDGRVIYFFVSDRGNGVVYALHLGTGQIRRISSVPAYVSSVKCTPDGNLLVCLATTPTLPFDVFAVPAEGGELRPVVDTNRDLLNSVQIAPTEAVTFKAPDGWDIEGWLVRPLDEKTTHPYPLILHIHGGPHLAFGNTFCFQAQVLAASGYASLYVNPRGSVGYGESFAQAADWGEKDYLDLMASVDAVLESGEVDSTRLGVTGLSFGGFMTNWILGHSDRFAAGVSINGLSNLVSFFGVSDIGSIWAPNYLGGAFWESEELWARYRHHSPITYVDCISTPLLLIQSENDFRCPIEQGEQLLSALRIRKQTVELVRIPGASHVIFRTGTPHQKYLERKLTHDWFDQYLGKNGHRATIQAVPAVTKLTKPAAGRE